MSESTAIRVLLDQGVPHDAAARLRELGYECTHVGEVGMCHASDNEILAFASANRSTVLTLDADFHTILAVSGAGGPSVIRVRIQGLRAPALVDLIRQVLTAFEADLKRGSLITIKARKTTCHRLPIGHSE